MSFKESRFGRVRQTAFQRLIVGNDQTVDQQLDHGRREQGVIRHHFADAIDSFVNGQTGISLLLQDFQLFLYAASFRQNNGSVDGKTGSLRIGEHLFHDVAHLVFLHLHSGNGRDRFPDTGIEQAKILVYLRGGADRRTGVAGVHLLFDCDCGGNAFYIVAFRLAHTSQKLAGVGGKAFDVAPLPFGI